MAEGDAASKTRTRARFGEGFLRDVWYFAALSDELAGCEISRP